MSPSRPDNCELGSILERWITWLVFPSQLLRKIVGLPPNNKACLSCVAQKQRLNRSGLQYASKHDLEIARQIAFNAHKHHAWHILYFVPGLFLLSQFAAWLLLQAAIRYNLHLIRRRS